MKAGSRDRHIGSIFGRSEWHLLRNSSAYRRQKRRFTKRGNGRTVHRQLPQPSKNFMTGLFEKSPYFSSQGCSSAAFISRRCGGDTGFKSCLRIAPVLSG